MMTSDNLLYPALLIENIEAGRITRARALEFLLENGVRRDVARKLLGKHAPLDPFEHIN
jgi:hypothetical protein